MTKILKTIKNKILRINVTKNIHINMNVTHASNFRGQCDDRLTAMAEMSRVVFRADVLCPLYEG